MTALDLLSHPLAVHILKGLISLLFLLAGLSIRDAFERRRQRRLKG